MRFSSTVYLLRYRIKFAHTARYKSKPHPAAINTNNIAIFPQLHNCLLRYRWRKGTVPDGLYQTERTWLRAMLHTLAASPTGAHLGVAVRAPGWFGRLRQGLTYLAVEQVLCAT